MVASAEFDPIVVDSSLTPATIDDLFGRGRESAKLDYKVALDPSIRHDQLEMIKDLVAMANTAGGYILIGVDDNGDLTGVSAEAVNALDETVIRAQLQSFIGVSLDVFVDRTVVREDKKCMIITVLRSPRSPIVFEKDGQYTPSGANRSRTVFRQGDVFVRHGSASERWNQDDVNTIYRRVVEREKERWLSDVVPDIKSVLKVALPEQPTPPSPREVLHADAEEFERIVRRTIRRGE